MAKVIKRGGGTQKPSSPLQRTPAKRTGKVIDRKVYQAQQDAQEIISQGEEENRKREAAGVESVQAAFDASFAEAQTEAEANLAFKLVQVFHQRRMLIATALEDVRTLGVEIINKVVGGQLHLSHDKLDAQSQTEERSLLAQRRLLLALPFELHQRMNAQAPALLDFIHDAPELELTDDRIEGDMGWVQTDSLRLAADGQTLLEQIAQIYGLPTPDLSEPAPAQPAAQPLEDLEEEPAEKTVAISLEELKSLAAAAQNRKKGED